MHNFKIIIIKNLNKAMKRGNNEYRIFSNLNITNLNFVRRELYNIKII